jgi:hypothetical protein
MADAAGGIQANRLRGALQSIQGGGKAAQRISGPAGVIPAMLEGQAAGRIINKAPAEEAAPLLQPALPPQSSNQAPDNTGMADYLQRVSRAESGGNPNARALTSSASGEYQFTDPTWKAMVAKHPEAGIGIGDKSNPTAQQKMAALLTQDNAQVLTSATGHQPNEGELYAAHLLGVRGALKLLQSDSDTSAASLFPKAAQANKNIFYNKGRPLTTGEVYAKLLAKVGT